MRHITKSRKHPPKLLVHKKSKHSCYTNLSTDCKNDIRSSLLNEQGHICCYCMQRIEVDNMKIEHWASQHYFPRKQLDYRNMLGSCKGGEGFSSHLQHCDTKKGDQSITVNPIDSERNCERKLKYSSRGEAYSDDEDIDNDLTTMLNLNIQTMQVNRKNVLDRALEDLSKRHSEGSWTKAILRTEIELWKAKRNGKLKPYCGVVINYLEQRLQKTK